MADNTTKTESQPDSVLGSLPSTRPQRLGRPRREVTAAKAQGRGARPAKPAPPRKRAAAPKVKPVPAKPMASKPVAVSAGCPPLERPRTTEPPPRPIGAPKGTELVTTAIQATGELARIGLMVGGRVLKRAVDRVPRP